VAGVNEPASWVRAAVDADALAAEIPPPSAVADTTSPTEASAALLRTDFTPFPFLLRMIV
jgi:hypothetical protein